MTATRRQFMACVAGGAALGTVAGPNRFALAAPAGKKIPIGLQLYSVRGLCGKDLPGTLAEIAKIGYKGVEFAGYYSRKADDMKKLLDDNGLVCCGTHTGWGTIQDAALKATIEFNKTLGNKYLIVPGGLPAKTYASVASCKETAKILADQAAKAKESGMRVGYHAHGGDFKKIDGVPGWDVLFENAGKDVVMQMDVGNCLGGGGDPYATIKKFPGQSVTIHLKEHGGAKGAPIGEGDVKWKEIFELCETVGGTEWYIVEHETGGNPLESVKACFEGLKKMGKV
jgi:sugar phosphate isomerase/epimerase